MEILTNGEQLKNVRQWYNLIFSPSSICPSPHRTVATTLPTPCIRITLGKRRGPSHCSTPPAPPAECRCNSVYIAVHKITHQTSHLHPDTKQRVVTLFLQRSAYRSHFPSFSSSPVSLLLLPASFPLFHYFLPFFLLFPSSKLFLFPLF